MGNSFITSVIIDDHFIAIREDENFCEVISHNSESSFLECIHESDREKFEQKISEHFAKQLPAETVGFRVLSSNQTWKWFSIMIRRIEGDSEKKRPMISLRLFDIDALCEGFDSLYNNHQMNRTFLDMMGAILLSYDLNTKFISVFTSIENRKVVIFEGTLYGWKLHLKELGIEADSLVDLDAYLDALERGKSFSVEINTSAFSQNHTYKSWLFKCQRLASNESMTQMVGCVVPRESLVDASEILGFDYSYDVGIKVLNKKSITEFAKQKIQEQLPQVTIVILDLDNFKAVNDIYGHLMGDEVLSTASEIIKRDVGSLGYVGRIGGDELMIVFYKALNHIQNRNILRAIRTDIELVFRSKLPKTPVTCSIGCARYPQDAADFDSVFMIADAMLLRAKEKGKNRYIIYDSEIHGVINKETNKLEISQKSENPVVETNKNKLLQDLIERYLIMQITSTDVVINHVANSFGLFEVLMVSSENGRIVQWKNGEMNYNLPSDEYFNVTDDFLALFNDCHEFILNGYYDFDGKNEEIQELLKKKGINTAIFTKMTKGGEPSGYMMFAKNKSGRKWSETEIAYLSTIGKLIDLSEQNR